MKPYADLPSRRARQVTGDLLLLAWVVGWVLVARLVHETVLLLARPGTKLEEAGSGLADRLRDAGSGVSETPLVGEELAAPFAGAGEAADQVAAAGASQVQAVGDIAFWLAVTIGAIPVLVALAAYLPMRWRFAREAGAGQRFVDSSADLDLFALRAMSRQPLHRLAQVSDDPAAAWRRGDGDVVRRLALLELDAAGLRPPP